MLIGQQSPTAQTQSVGKRPGMSSSKLPPKKLLQHDFFMEIHISKTMGFGRQSRQKKSSFQIEFVQPLFCTAKKLMLKVASRMQARDHQDYGWRF